MRCCVCRAVGIEVHHIVPLADGGPDELENAAPLCPSCHETYGANPQKRKFIRESRDLWYEICERRSGPLEFRLEELSSLLRSSDRRVAALAAEIADLKAHSRRENVSSYGWECFVRFSGPQSSVDAIRHELARYSPMAKIDCTASDSGFAFAIDTPLFIPEEIYELAATHHACTFQDVSYIG